MRCVDDMSASLINATTFAEERISLHLADVMASAVVEWCDSRDAADRPRDLTAKSFDLKWGFQADGGLSKVSQESGIGHQRP